MGIKNILIGSFLGAFFVSVILSFSFVKDQKDLPAFGIKGLKVKQAWGKLKIRYQLPQLDDDYVAMQISLSKDANSYLGLLPGMSIEESEVFAPGTGIAVEADRAVNELYVSEEADGHNYIFYQDEKVKRVELHRINNGVQYFKLLIERYIDNGESYPVKEYPHELFACFFCDLNQNGILDEGEFEVMNVN